MNGIFLLCGAVKKILALDVSKNMELLETKFRNNNKDWTLYPIVVQASSAEEYKTGLSAIEDRVVDHEFPVVFTAFYPQEHSDNDFSNFMTSVLDLVKPMVKVGLLPVTSEDISSFSAEEWAIFMAQTSNAFNMFAKVPHMNFVYLAQNSDPPVPEAKPGTYIQRLHARLSSYMPRRQDPPGPLTPGSLHFSSNESAALFPRKRARDEDPDT